MEKRVFYKNSQDNTHKKKSKNILEADESII